MRASTLLLFFLSGLAGLVYEVTWARSLGLVFGASHLAVTTVLAVFMAGQALGGAFIGPRIDRAGRPLRLYGLLEIAAGLAALVGLLLFQAYPHLYPPIARVAERNVPWLTLVRVLFAVAVMIVPTTLLGGTLPALARASSAGTGRAVPRSLAVLYAVNTAGAVAGALLAGFVALPGIGVTASWLAAAALSVGVGLGALALDRRPAPPARDARTEEPVPRPEQAEEATPVGDRLVLAAASAAGFCALGDEVLWTRMLGFALGTSAYAFTLILAAFLAGIGLGSRAWAPVGRRIGSGRPAALAFAATQLLAGAAAIAVTVAMRDLPGIALRARWLVGWVGASEFTTRLATAEAVSAGFVFLPAFLFGLAFPAAGAALEGRGDRVGAAVGRLLAANTLGAIAGAAVTGFALVHVTGIERSLQILAAVNVAAGLALAAAATRRRALLPVVGAVLVAAIAVRIAWPGWGLAWDRQRFGTFVNNVASVDLEARSRDVEVAYLHEGINETVSVVRAGGELSFVVNGRPEASTGIADAQILKALGHVPMLLHPAPRRVFVLGTGTGMTLGAVARHPGVERLVLAEIERGALGAARQFERWNGRVLDDPRLDVVFNDGRNFLATTSERFDVITADPIHPWSGGAAYLYTVDYFRAVAARLAPGGIAAHWLPIYELSDRDLRTIVRSFAQGFRHVQVWLTFYDAVLVGSDAPIVIDEQALSRRLGDPAIRADLAAARMGGADELLSWFLAGDAGARAFGAGGDLNTDDNLVLEFSAPRSQGLHDMGADMRSLSSARESVLAYLAPAAGGDPRARAERWAARFETGRRFDELHALFLEGATDAPAWRQLGAELAAREPGYPPLRFLEDEAAFWARTRFEPVSSHDFPALGSDGPSPVRVVAARKYLGRGRVLVVFVDEEMREIFGHRYVDGEYEGLEEAVQRTVAEAFETLAVWLAPPAGAVPPRDALLAALRREIARSVGPPPGRGLLATQAPRRR
jgi:spermidine synthase